MPGYCGACLQINNMPFFLIHFVRAKERSPNGIKSYCGHIGGVEPKGRARQRQKRLISILLSLYLSPFHALPMSLSLFEARVAHGMRN